MCYFPLLIFSKSTYCLHAYIEIVNSWIQPGLEFVEIAKWKAKGWESLNIKKNMADIEKDTWTLTGQEDTGREENKDVTLGESKGLSVQGALKMSIW